MRNIKSFEKPKKTEFFIKRKKCLCCECKYYPQFNYGTNYICKKGKSCFPEYEGKRNCKYFKEGGTK